MTLEISEEQRRRLRHDLRTPLTIIGGFAEVLAAERPLADADRREYAARIVAATAALRQLLDDVLEEDQRSV
jgi:signal transduction histidine kinase